MKLATTTLYAASLAGLILTVGCNKKPAEEKAEIRQEAAKDIAEEQREASKDVSDIREEAREDIADVNEGVAAENKDTFADRYENRLNLLDDRIEKTSDLADDKSNAGQNVTAPVIADVKAKREAAAAQIKGLRDANDNGWSNMRGNVEMAFNELETAVVKAESEVAAH